MLFHEIYGVYFRTVGRILKEAAETEVTPARIRQIVAEHAFAESNLTIPDALLEGKWPLLDEDGRSLLLGAPETGITTLEKRWLKSLLLDPRIALFAPEDTGLENVTPLYEPERIFWFDRYADADPYESPEYVACFRALCAAIREKKWMGLCYESAKGKESFLRALPLRLEYSEKDDKFRLRVRTERGSMVMNVARIKKWELLTAAKGTYTVPEPESKRMVLELTDQRNALERVLLHFSHLKKETVRLEEDKYLLTLWYSPEDEREMLIRVLSFGSVLQVKAPEEMVSQVRGRIRRQMRFDP